MFDFIMSKVIEPMSVFILIILLVSFMNQGNQLYTGCKTAVYYMGRVTNRVGVILLALLIVGLLPIRNKALIGAPVMKDIGEIVNMRKYNNAAVSFFGGHMHYMTSPLSSSLALIMTMGAVSFHEIILGGLWIPALIWVILSIVQIRFNKENQREACNTAFRLKNMTKMPVHGLMGLLPIVTIFVLALSTNLHYRWIILIAISVAVVVQLLEGILFDTIFPSIKETFKKMDWKLIGIIFAVLNLSIVITETGIVHKMPSQYILVFAFLAGIICGSSSTTVAISMGVFGCVVMGQPALVAQMYLACFLGYILSPVHRCIFINAKIFEVSLVKLYITNVIICAIVGSLGFFFMSLIHPLI